MKHPSFFFVCATGALLGCRAHSPRPAPISSAPISSAPEVPARDESVATYTLVHLKTGPKSGRLPEAENRAAFAGHFANMERMAQAGELLVAGPYGDSRHDAALRGIFLMSSADPEQARAWAASDPTTQAGVFVQECHELVTDAPLARALRRALERVAAARAAGREPGPGEFARPYVLLTAPDLERARRVLAPLQSAEGGVFLFGVLDRDQAFCVLDAENEAQARDRFGPELDEIGPHALDDWYASDELARLVDPVFD